MVTTETGPGNFICAGGDCFEALLSSFIDKHNGSEFFDEEQLSIFLYNTINKYLYSFGSGLSYKTKKISKNHTKKIVDSISEMKNRPFMKNIELYIDSGGFQVAMGAIKTPDMPHFINVYHDFLKDNYKTFEYAFSLDLPPGPSSAEAIFSSYNQIEELNRLSYTETSKLNQEIKDKMIYVHHFRTPSLYDTWSKFLWEENLADGYTNFATGGIVANMATDLTIPVIIYSIPLSEILKYVMDKGLTSFNFHVLGGANFVDVFYHKLFAYHIKKIHNVDVKITYDSSAIFKALAIGRFIPVFDSNGSLKKMDLRSNNIHLRFDNQYTVELMTYKLLKILSETFGFKILDINEYPIYDKETKSLTRPVHVYLMFYILYAYRLLELQADEFVRKIYPLFEQNKIDDFDELCYDFTQKINQGKNTKKQKAKTASIFRSLNILTNLDRDYNRYLIHKFMSNDDISIMLNGGMPKF